MYKFCHSDIFARLKRQIKSGNSGFTLVELLVVVAIIAVLAGVIAIMINPIESIRKARDSRRLEDMQSLRQGIEYTRGEFGLSNQQVLCGGNPIPCSGSSYSSDPNFRKSDGTGWLRVQFPPLIIAILPILPIDPINDSSFYYLYYSDGADYELNTKLESATFRDKMQQDGGDNNGILELGSRLNLVP